MKLKFFFSLFLTPSLFFIPLFHLISCNKSQSFVPLDPSALTNPFSKTTYDTSQVEISYNLENQKYEITKIKQPEKDFNMIPTYDDKVHGEKPIEIEKSVLNTLHCKNFIIHDYSSFPTFKLSSFHNLNVSYIYIQNLDNFENNSIAFDKQHRVGIFIYGGTTLERSTNSEIGMFEGSKERSKYGIEFIIFKGSSIETIPSKTFKGCDNLSILILPPTVTTIKSHGIEADNIYDQISLHLQKFYFPKNLTTIQKNAFHIEAKIINGKKAKCIISTSCQQTIIKDFIERKSTNPTFNYDINFDSLECSKFSSAYWDFEIV